MISVIVPAYNNAPYLGICLRSILNQTCCDMEIVCTDDGSTDGSGAVLDERATENKNIIVIHKVNAGVTIARLSGVEIAQGDNIGFCDGDDEIEPEMYETLLCNKVKYNADISHCGHKVVCPDGREKYFYNTGRIAVQDSSEALKELLMGSFEPSLCSKLFSNSLLHRLLHSENMTTEIKINEDLLMNYYLFCKSEKNVFEDICLYNYLKRDGSASRTKSIYHIWNPIKVKEIIRKDSIGTSIEPIARAAYLNTCLNCYHGLVGDKDFRNEKKKILKLISDNADDIKYLSPNRARYVKLLMLCPAGYDLIRKIYSRLK